MALGALKRLVRGLARTRQNLASTLQQTFGGAVVDEQALDDLEAGLLAADLGPALTEEVMQQVRQRVQQGQAGEGVRQAVRDTLREALRDSTTTPTTVDEGPHVTFVVGVNGGGKTTTVGKLAARERAAGRTVMVVAADTFRAAAIEQLERWSERSDVEFSKKEDGADPAAVVFDALRAARSRKLDRVLVDTAGRLHTKTNLMAELAKLVRVAAREVPGAPHDVLLVVDATTGQNGLTQAEEFTRAAQLTGVVLTKLDGTAKGGVALGIHRRLGVPIRYVGVGETVDDLLEFNPDAFLDGLLGDDVRTPSPA
jgi:fused signal recognition particle receptor